MSAFACGFVVGLILGGPVGYAVAAIIAAGGDADGR